MSSSSGIKRKSTKAFGQILPKNKQGGKAFSDLTVAVEESPRELSRSLSAQEPPTSSQGVEHGTSKSKLGRSLTSKPPETRYAASTPSNKTKNRNSILTNTANTKGNPRSPSPSTPSSRRVSDNSDIQVNVDGGNQELPKKARVSLLEAATSVDNRTGASSSQELLKASGPPPRGPPNTPRHGSNGSISPTSPSHQDSSRPGGRQFASLMEDKEKDKAALRLQQRWKEARNAGQIRAVFKRAREAYVKMMAEGKEDDGEGRDEEVPPQEGLETPTSPGASSVGVAAVAGKANAFRKHQTAPAGKSSTDRQSGGPPRGSWQTVRRTILTGVQGVLRQAAVAEVINDLKESADKHKHRSVEDRFQEAVNESDWSKLCKVVSEMAKAASAKIHESARQIALIDPEAVVEGIEEIADMTKVIKDIGKSRIHLENDVGTLRRLVTKGEKCQPQELDAAIKKSTKTAEDFDAASKKLYEYMMLFGWGMVPVCSAHQHPMVFKTKATEWPLIFCKVCETCDSICDRRQYWVCLECTDMGLGGDDGEYINCPACVGEPNDGEHHWVGMEKFQRMCINPFDAVAEWSRVLEQANELLKRLGIRDNAAFVGLMKFLAFKKRLGDKKEAFQKRINAINADLDENLKNLTNRKVHRKNSISETNKDATSTSRFQQNNVRKVILEKRRKAEWQRLKKEKVDAAGALPNELRGRLEAMREKAEISAEWDLNDDDVVLHLLSTMELTAHEYHLIKDFHQSRDAFLKGVEESDVDDQVTPTKGRRRRSVSGTEYFEADSDDDGNNLCASGLESSKARSRGNTDDIDSLGSRSRARISSESLTYKEITANLPGFLGCGSAAELAAMELEELQKIRRARVEGGPEVQDRSLKANQRRIPNGSRKAVDLNDWRDIKNGKAVDLGVLWRKKDLQPDGLAAQPYKLMVAVESSPSSGLDEIQSALLNASMSISVVSSLGPQLKSTNSSKFVNSKRTAWQSMATPRWPEKPNPTLKCPSPRPATPSTKMAFDNVLPGLSGVLLGAGGNQSSFAQFKYRKYV